MIADHFRKTVNSHSVLLLKALRTKRAKTLRSQETGNDNSPRIVCQRFNILSNAPTSEKRNSKWRLERALPKHNNLFDVNRFKVHN